MPHTKKKVATPKLGSVRTPIPLIKGMYDSLFGEGRIRFFSTKELSALSKSCRRLHGEVATELQKSAASKLLQHVILGEQETSNKMIAANPSLILIRTKAKDYSGRIIHGTPFQAALGAEDERMWEMMIPYFYSLETKGVIKSAQQTMKAQFDQQFPDGIAVTTATDLQPNYDALAKAIIEGADKGKSAIEMFRERLTEHKVIESGKHFNMQHLIAAYQAYTENFDDFATWDDADKFWQKVIGFVQRQMPANYAHTHCTGVQRVVDNPANFKRTFSFNTGGDFFPVSADSGLGFDFGCYSWQWGSIPGGGARCGGAVRRYGSAGMAWPEALSAARIYLKQKQEILQELSSSLNQVQVRKTPQYTLL